jgi:hypothetical protein
VKDGFLVIGFRSDLLRDKMEKNHNVSKACQAAEDILGTSIKLRCILISAWSPGREQKGGEATQVEEDGMVATAIRDLGAQVVDVEQYPPE